MSKHTSRARWRALALLAAHGEPARADGEQFFPLLVYRTGPYAPNGIPSPTA